MSDADRLLNRAPWTQAEVDALNSHQKSGLFHPYTCVSSNHGSLIATERGWVCSKCLYTQDWALNPLHEGDIDD